MQHEPKKSQTHILQDKNHKLHKQGPQPPRASEDEGEWEELEVLMAALFKT